MKKKFFIPIIVGLLVIAILSGAIVASAAIANKSATSQTVKYQNPDIGDMVGDNSYPEPQKSNENPETKEKKWYEYIAYSDIQVSDPYKINDKERVLFYDPYDYTYGMIMEVEDTIYGNVSQTLESINYTDRKSICNTYDLIDLLVNKTNYATSMGNIKDIYSTANSKTISYVQSFSHTNSDSRNDSISLGFEEKLEAGFLAEKFSMTLKQSFSWGHTWGWNNTISSSTTVSQTFNAAYFNSDGAPLPWKLVHYTVWLPIMCVHEKQDAQGEWHKVDTSYYLMSVAQGICRQFKGTDGNIYIESWTSGEVVLYDGWSKILTKEALIDTYKNKVTPEKKG